MDLILRLRVSIAGLSFIGSNISSSMNEQLLSPIGFNIIFPGMINYAIEMGLDLPLRQCDIDAMFSMREVELRRYEALCRVMFRNYLVCFCFQFP